MPLPTDFLHDLYDRLNETPMQRRLRRLAPMPIGAVFIQWPEMTDAEIRGQFRTMKELGYNCLKQIMPCAGTTLAKLQTMALEEGLIPWWYDQAGWQEPTPELLARLGLPKDLDIDAALVHPKVIAHQRAAMQARIERQANTKPSAKSSAVGPGDADPDPAALPGTNLVARGAYLAESGAQRFVAWLKTQYRDVAELQHAWNCASCSHEGAGLGWKTWDDVVTTVAKFPMREFRHLRDIMRFKSDMRLDRLRDYLEECRAADADEPTRAGGEISIFLPHVSSGIDMEGYAQIMATYGCFYPSMHPGWHLEEVGYELVRPTFMQASMCVDWSKGVWSAPIESSGGPQWFSGGGKVPFVPEVKPLQPAFTFNEHTMEQLLFSYLGAGFKGFGLWCWNPREASTEAGEYALCDRNNQPTPRARTVGAIGQAMRRLRRELWSAHKEPLVGVFQDWENDAIWAAMAVCGRDRYRDEPTKARIGATRALINANVPWEHVTLRQLELGLAPRYGTIYLPAVINLSAKLLQILTAYVQQGGRVVIDMPGAYLDERAHLVDTRPGSPFEKLFGAVLHEYAYANNEPFALGDPARGGIKLTGFTAVMTSTTARVVETYGNGAAAITENRFGEGTAVILGAEASLACLKPGRTEIEHLLVRTALGARQVPFTCTNAIAYRLAAPAADHYFLINDGPATTAILDTRAYRYRTIQDAVTGETIAGPIPLPAHGGRWLRLEKTAP